MVMNFVTETRKYSPQTDSEKLDIEKWNKRLTLYPGFQLRCMELNAPRNVAVDFRRDHPFLEFGCLLSGKLTGFARTDNGQNRYVEGHPGQTWCSFHNKSRGTIEYLAGQTVRVVLFHLHGPLLENLSLPRKGHALNTSGRLTPAVNKIVQQIIQINDHTDTCNQLLLTSKAYELLFHLSSYENEDTDPDHSAECRQKVKKAQDILNHNLASPPCLSDLARKTGLCKTNLATQFKKQSGTTVFGYLRQQRLARAKELITLHNLSASEAAWEVGYSSLSSFHRAFCARYGATPGSFAPKP